MGPQLPVLFSPWFRQIGRVVVGADHYALQRPLVQQIGDVERERRVAALVLAAGAAIDPDGRTVIDRTEVQQDAAAIGWPHEAKVAAVPARMIEALVTHAARRRLRRERHRDGAIPEHVGGPAIDRIVVERELPLAVEGHPAFAHELWPWVATAQIEVGGRSEM